MLAVVPSPVSQAAPVPSVLAEVEPAGALPPEPMLCAPSQYCAKAGSEKALAAPSAAAPMMIDLNIIITPCRVRFA
jgi:hypothetical protein